MVRKEAHRSPIEAGSLQVEPRMGETPQGYISRLAHEVYPDQLQGSLLEAFDVCFRIARVGSIHVAAYPQSDTTRVKQIFVLESLVSAQARCDQELREGKAVDLFDYPVTLQPEAAAEVVYTLNRLQGRLMRKLSSQPSRTTTMDSLPPLSRSEYFLPLLRSFFERSFTGHPHQFRGDRRIAKGMDTGEMEQELVGECQSLVTSIGIERQVTLQGLTDLVLLTSEMFERFGIDDRVWDHMVRLTDVYYQLDA